MGYRYLDTKSGIRFEVYEESEDSTSLTFRMTSLPMGNDPSYQVWVMNVPFNELGNLIEFLKIKDHDLLKRYQVGV